MRCRAAGTRAHLLHEGAAVARGAKRDLGLKSDFLWYLRQHRLQKAAPQTCAFRSTNRATHQSRVAVSPLIIKAVASRRTWYFHLCTWC